MEVCVCVCVHKCLLIDNMQEFLTLAERQFIIKYELESLRALEVQRIPGVPAPLGHLKSRENVCKSLPYPFQPFNATDDVTNLLFTDFHRFFLL